MDFTDLRKPKKLDISGISISPAPSVSDSQDREIISRGEDVGFIAREPSAIPVGESGGGEYRKGGRRKKGPRKDLFISAPVDIADWFVGLTEEMEFDAYWQTLAHLKKLSDSSKRH
jgi:hypothetical protein